MSSIDPGKDELTGFDPIHIRANQLSLFQLPHYYAIMVHSDGDKFVALVIL